MASDPSSTSSTPAGSPNSSWSADPDVLKTLVGLLSSSVDPFANHSEVYRQLQQLQAHLQGDFELYLVFLMAQWNNPGLRVEVCQAAGLLLKQSVKSKYKDGVSESAKGFVKGALLNMFLQTDGNGQYKSKGRASIYFHGGIANIRAWLEALQDCCFLRVIHIKHKH